MAFFDKKIERVSTDVLQTINRQLDLYLARVDASDLPPETKTTYKRHARKFVRWLHGDFQPGSNL